MAVCRACLLLYAGLLWFPGSEAGTVRNSDVRYNDGVYSVEMDMEIEADIGAVRAIITDYADIHRVSNLLTGSSLMDAPEEGGIRRRLAAKICILFFCFKSEIVEDVEEVGRDTVLTTVVPEMSDFLSGNSRWNIRSLDEEHSLLRFHYDMEPDFWIPPVIGPLLIKRKLLREAEDTIEMIEALAREE